MTEREQIIIKRVLGSLKVVLPTLLGEAVLHSSVNVKLANEGLPEATRDEFEGCLRLADAAGLLTSVRNPVTGALRWTVSDQGIAAMKSF